jgi:beta-lactamase class A
VKVVGAIAALCLVLGAASAFADLTLGTRVVVPTRARAAATAAPLPSATPSLTTPVPATPTAAPASFDELESQVEGLLEAAGAMGSVSLIELGSSARSWSLNGDETFVAASTYKLPLLMEEAQQVTAGNLDPNEMLCYEPGDWEDGWYSDYAPGECYTRAELERRVGTYSDNTAAHILVRVDGGGDSLNAYARAHGASESEFWDPNLTTSADLARLWKNEAEGLAGGPAAQRYLYPLLTSTAYEDGIPAGMPAGTMVVHKIGNLDGEVNDAGLVVSGPHGPYVLAVLTEGGSWSLIAEVARAVSGFEGAA